MPAHITVPFAAALNTSPNLSVSDGISLYPILSEAIAMPIAAVKNPAKATKGRTRIQAAFRFES